jgi:hypothetical protein
LLARYQQWADVEATRIDERSVDIAQRVLDRLGLNHPFDAVQRPIRRAFGLLIGNSYADDDSVPDYRLVPSPGLEPGWLLTDGF